ncbi:hypothetical protein GCM10010191_30190 [Actinomadura vinacea]|uniref:DUF1653 domain-containing protein n=1 Tax=Actinomadura vinacea TaxID=115336 RepID=A0ABN3J050_9ACTN
MREQTFPYDHHVLARFPGARSYERAPDRITYLAERAGTPCLLVVPAAPGEGPLTVTVLEFEDERERGAYLAARDRTAPAAT